MRTGVHGLSIRNLTNLAGLTVGAFYSNFSSRQDYLEKLCGLVIGEFLETIRSANARACQGAREMAVEVYADWSVNVPADLAAAMLEFGVLARSDKAFGAAYAVQAAQFRAALAEEMRTLFRHFGLTPQMSCEQMAAGFMTMWMGQILFQDMPEGKDYTQAIALFLSNLLLAARSREEQE